MRKVLFTIVLLNIVFAVSAIAQTDEIRQLRERAEKGEADAQNSLGYMYQRGSGVPQSEVEAVNWYRKAAEQGNALAQSNLGFMYLKGLGVAQSDIEAVKWYRKAAEQGESYAQNNLGTMYENGNGIPKSDAEAVKWYRKAAEQGNAFAQRNLGRMYEKGRGVSQSDVEAVKWYRKAAEQGNAFAQRNLGQMYEKGRGVSQSDAEAVKWYRKAAEQGYVLAQRNLGQMYEKGRGVSQSDAEAVKWYRKAAEQGNDYAKKRLDYLTMQERKTNRSDNRQVSPSGTNVYPFEYKCEKSGSDVNHFCEMKEHVPNGNNGTLEIDILFKKGIARNTCIISIQLIDFRTASTLTQWRKKIETSGALLGHYKQLDVSNQCYLYFDNAQMKVLQGLIADNTIVWAHFYEKKTSEMSSILLTMSVVNGEYKTSAQSDLLSTQDLRRIEFDGKSYEINAKTAKTIKAMYKKILDNL